MPNTFTFLFDAVLSEQSSLSNVYCASGHNSPPEECYQVSFPRLELVFKGNYENAIEDSTGRVLHKNLKAGDALFIPANAWNKPNWQQECSVLSLLFGTSQLGFSLVSKHANDEGFYDVIKHSVPRHPGSPVEHILAALTALNYQESSDNTVTLKALILALVGASKTLVDRPKLKVKNRSEELYKSICIYVQENFHKNITRDTVATRFNVSASHLSRVFRQEGHMRFADYISWVRLERAKFLLKNYPFKLDEISRRSGFQDPNYFCRVFKSKTGKTPTQYRLN
jgi:AraC-like DNA-binding protein